MKFLNRIGFTALPVRCVDTCKSIKGGGLTALPVRCVIFDTCKSIKVVEVYYQKVLDKYVVAFTCLFSCTEVFERKLKLENKGIS